MNKAGCKICNPNKWLKAGFLQFIEICDLNCAPIKARARQVKDKKKKRMVQI